MTTENKELKKIFDEVREEREAGRPNICNPNSLKTEAREEMREKGIMSASEKRTQDLENIGAI